MALRVEPSGESILEHCPDCGNATRSVWGYIFGDGSPRAAYFMRWTDGHRERGADLLLSIGGWGGGDERERRAVALECQAGPEGPGFSIVDAKQSPWRDRTLGVPQQRDDVLGTQLANECFSFVDALVEGDARFRNFLRGSQAASA